MPVRAVAKLVSKGHTDDDRGGVLPSRAWHGSAQTPEIVPGKREVILTGVAGGASRWAGEFFSQFTLPRPTAELFRTALHRRSNIKRLDPQAHAPRLEVACPHWAARESKSAGRPLSASASRESA